MINTCSKVASQLLSLEFNVNKSHCMVFGTFYKKNIAPLSVGSSILWTSTVKYLGVHLLCGRYVKFDLMPVKLFTHHVIVFYA